MPAIEDDPFDEIVSGLVLDVNEDEVVNVQGLSTKELIDMRDEITDSLMHSQSLFRNNTDWRRDQHSLRAAIIVELARRGLP